MSQAYLTLEIKMRTVRKVPEYGERRKVTKFCLLPLEIRHKDDNGRTIVERAFFETATWEEEWARGRHDSMLLQEAISHSIDKNKKIILDRL